jgi:hypothetical protein
LLKLSKKDADARKVANKVKPVGPVVAPEVQEQEEALYKIAEETKLTPIFCTKSNRIRCPLAANQRCICI